MLAAYERGVSWQRVQEVLKDHTEADGPNEAIQALDGLKPEPVSTNNDGDEAGSSPSLDENREAWCRLNRAFK